MEFKSITQLKTLLDENKISVKEIAETYIKRINEKKELNKEQNKLETITKNLSLNSQEKNFINFLNKRSQDLNKAKDQLDNNQNDKARETIKNTILLRNHPFS